MLPKKKRDREESAQGEGTVFGFVALRRAIRVEMEIEILLGTGKERGERSEERRREKR